MTANGVGTCGADDNQAQAGHLIAQCSADREELMWRFRNQDTTREGSIDELVAEMDTPETVIGGGLVHSLTSEGHDASEDGTGRGTPVICVTGDRTHALTTLCAAAEEDGTGRGSPLVATPSDTIVRRLTELECERLQGYPDGWTEGQTASARYRQLGNSVAVPCVEWIARRLVAVHDRIEEVPF